MSKLAIAVLVVAVPALAVAPVVERGKFLFVHAWTRFDPESHGGDGVGPTYNASSCVECHHQGGTGGAGAQNVTSVNGRVHHVHGTLVTFDAVERPFARRVVRQTMELVDVTLGDLTGELHERRGEVLHAVTARKAAFQDCFDRAKIASARSHARVAVLTDDAGAVGKVDITAESVSDDAFDKCVKREMTRIRFPATAGASAFQIELDFERIEHLAPAPPQPDPVVTARNTPALFGDGLIDAIPDDVIEAAAATSIALHPEIRGVVGRTPEGRVARFGWKGDTPDLFTFVSRACSNEVGLEVPGVPQPGKRSPGYDLDLDDVTALTEFVRSLPRPREERRSPQASEGAELFDSIGCTACHRESLGDVDGIFSDLLLHDMGASLDDVSNSGSYGAPPSTATSRMWRTPPLWGVRDSGPWLHDGRAQTLARAIELHAGEASRAQFAWSRRLDDDGRASIIAFLESLQAPTSTANATE
jgi:hypothetical protein